MTRNVPIQLTQSTRPTASKHTIECANALDHLALIACQNYNLGNAANWFFSFRGGHYGVISRLHGLHRHSTSLYEWRTSASYTSHENDVATILFCMDSAIECFTFMLNAFGQATDKGAFRDVSSDAALRRISPDDVLGSNNRAPIAGYLRYFPTLQSHWQSKAILIRLIFSNHDVTKHRQQAGVSGRFRLDPPPELYERLGLSSDPAERFAFGPAAPMETVYLPKNPKLPIEQRTPDLSEFTTLEQTELEFYDLIESSFHYALEDARASIRLNYSALQAPR